MKARESSNWFSLIVCALLGVLIYSQGVNDLWLFDDGPNLVDNRLLDLVGTDADSWRTASFSSGSGVLRRPVSMASFAAQVAIEGQLSPQVAKAVNIAIHFFNAGLIFLLFRLILRVTPGALPARWSDLIAGLAAVAWALHPLHVSTVLYAVQRMAQLSTLFVLLGLWMFLRWRIAWAQRGASTGEVVAAGLWLLLITAIATLAKENGALLPWLIVALEVSLFRGRWSGAEVPWLSRLAWLAFSLPALVLFAAYLLPPEWLLQRYGTRDFTLQERVLTQARILWQYLGWLVWPDIAQMGVHHDDFRLSHKLMQPVSTLWSLLGWVMAMAVALLLRHRYPLLLFALLFYLVGHSMESTIWPLMMVFEHRNYLPSVGFFLLVSWGLVSVSMHFDKVDPRIPAFGWIALLLMFLFFRVSVWSDELRLAQANVVNLPESSRSHFVYANVLLRQYEGQTAGAEEFNEDERVNLLQGSRLHYAEALHYAPDDLATLVTLYQLDGKYFLEHGQSEHWLARILELLKDKPRGITDKAALKALMRCLGTGGCRGGREVFDKLLALMGEHHSQSSLLDVLEYEYLKASGAPAPEWTAALERAVTAAPNNIKLLYKLLWGYIAMEDMGKSYELARRIMLADPHRLQTTALTNLYPDVVMLSHETR